jgi:diguanylate cyclase
MPGLTVYYDPSDRIWHGAEFLVRSARRVGGANRVYKQDREQALAKTALALMGECDVAPIPEHFELFYAYAAGENPSISRIVGDMIAARKPFTPAVLAELRAKCLLTARAQNTVDSVGAHMTDALNTAIAKLEAAGKDASDYGRALKAASGELDDGQSPAELRKLLSNIQGATREMEMRSKTLEGELQKSSQEIHKLRAQLEDVRKESLTDGLTGIANRKAFDAELQSAISDSIADEQPMALFMCDIDRFKQFNDTWGHQTGDQVLRLVGNCLSENVKGRDTAARYGGEEFAVILRKTSLADAIKLAEQIRSNVESKKLVKKSTGDILGTITISIGVAQFADRETAASLIKRADACLYRAKRSGRNCVIGETDPRFAGAEIDAA